MASEGSPVRAAAASAVAAGSRRRGLARRRPAVALAAAAVALWALLAQPWGLGAPAAEALALLGKSKRGRAKPKVLFTYRNYELKFLPRGKGKGLTSNLPRLKLEKIPPKRVAFTSLGGSVEGPLDKEFATFPFTTHNTAAVQLGFPRVDGKLKLSAVDPPVSSDLLDAEDASKTLEADYEQLVPDVGELGLKVKSTGEWGARYSRDVEDLGHLRATVNSHLDWSADLEKGYPTFRGVAPTVNYGATQDGMRVKARLDRVDPAPVRASYTVQNLPGKYAPADFLHDVRVSTSTGSGRHTLEATGLYDRRFPKVPVRGSMAYTVRTAPVNLEASVDYDRYRLKAQSKRAQVSAALGTKASLSDSKAGILGRPAEMEVKVGKAVASARFREGRPRVRLDVAV